MMAAGSTRQRPRTAPACRAWPTVLRPSADPSRSAPGQGTDPPSPGASRCSRRDRDAGTAIFSPPGLCRAMSGAGLDEMIALVLQALTPGLPQRQQARAHPYTADGRQVDVLLDDRWVEVGERCLAHRPFVLGPPAAARGGGRPTPGPAPG